MSGHISRWIVPLVVAFVAVGASAEEKPPAFDVAAFGALPQADRLQFVLAKLDARERQLQNFSYELKETHVNIANVGGKQRFMYWSDYTVRRIGPKWWMHLVNSVYYVPDKTGGDALLNWDGKRAGSINFPPYLGVPYAKCSVGPTENGNFHQRWYNELLGFEVSTSECEGMRESEGFAKPRHPHGTSMSLSRIARRP